MKKQNFTFFQYVWIFVAGCYGGFLVETVWCLIKNGYIESRKSLVLGHLSVAYGMGAVLLTLILVHFQQSKLWKIFLVAFCQVRLRNTYALSGRKYASARSLGITANFL